jgi:hypothetical protein
MSDDTGRDVCGNNGANLQDKLKMNEAERRKNDVRKIDLYRMLLRHVTAILCILVELHLGYKVDLRAKR